MALLYQAELNPSKLELLQTFVPTIGGLDVANGSELAVVGAYRFDDPDGEVGIEAHLLSHPDGRTIHIPLTYRAAPLDGAEEWLVGTMEHSALGTRWVYDACGDPIYAAELVRTILVGDTQVKLEVMTDDGLVERENTVKVKGSGEETSAGADGSWTSATRSGTETVVAVGATNVAVQHVLTEGSSSAEPNLSGTWSGVTTASVFAAVRG